jgi:hypothetical protein
MVISGLDGELRVSVNGECIILYRHEDLGRYETTGLRLTKSEGRTQVSMVRDKTYVCSGFGDQDEI